MQSRVGRGYRELAEDEHQFIVDFTGPSLAALQPGAAVTAMVSAPSNGEILETNAYHVEATGAWRMMVLVKQLDGPTWWPTIPMIFVTPLLTFALHRRFVYS